MTSRVVQVSASDEVNVGADKSASVMATSHIWLVWTEIAIDHERAARQAREQAVFLKPGGSPEFSEALSQELRASMVAVAAASHAIDAFHASVKGQGVVPADVELAWSKSRTKRPAQILETLKLGFAVGKAAQRWHSEFRWLFDLRDGVVHAEERWQTLQPHPVGGKMAPEHVMYSLESSARAVELVFDVMDTCFANPKPNGGQLNEFLAMLRHVPARLRQRREGPVT